MKFELRKLAEWPADSAAKCIDADFGDIPDMTPHFARA